MSRRHDDDMPPEWLTPGRANRAAPKPKSAKTLLAKELPPAKWAVPGVLPEGITILAGKPKMGKSWLALGLCIAVTAGGYALGKIPVERGAALYLALEDTDRRLQKRLRKALAGDECPEGLAYETEWLPLTEGGVRAIREWIEQHPDARLIVIDILKRVRSREQVGRSMYDVDYEALEPLKPLVEEYGVSILVIHHLRQLEAADPLEMISGTSGLTGVADGALILKRDRGKQDATLVIDGRDIEEPAELALRWDADIAAWAHMGDADEFRMSQERRDIVDLLRRANEPLGPKDIADALEKKPGAIRYLLTQMVQDGEVIAAGYGKYIAPNTPNTPNTPNSPNTPNASQGVRGEGTSVRAARRTPNTSMHKTPANGQGVSGVGGVRSDTEDGAPVIGDSGGRLSAAQADRVQKLIHQGMSAKHARAEVLGVKGNRA